MKIKLILTIGLIFSLSLNSFSSNVVSIPIDGKKIYLGQNLTEIQKELALVKSMNHYGVSDSASIEFKLDKSENKIDGVKIDYRFFTVKFFDSLLFQLECIFDDYDSAFFDLKRSLLKQFGKPLFNSKTMLRWETSSYFIEIYAINNSYRGNIKFQDKVLLTKYQNRCKEYEERDRVRNGYVLKGNSTFVPNFSFCNKLFTTAMTLSLYEKTFPFYKREIHDTTNNLITYLYEFYGMYQRISLNIVTDLSGKVKRLSIIDGIPEKNLMQLIKNAGYKSHDIANKYDRYTTSKHFKTNTNIYFSYNGNDYSWQR